MYQPLTYFPGSGAPNSHIADQLPVLNVVYYGGGLCGHGWFQRRRADATTIQMEHTDMVESLMFVTGLVLFRGWLEEVRPIEHYPNRVVAVLARHGSDVAVEELEQRCGSGRLSKRQRHGAADICLAELSRRNPSRAWAACLILLTQMDTAGDLDLSQSAELKSLLFPDIEGPTRRIIEWWRRPPDIDRKIRYKRWEDPLHHRMWDRPGKWMPADIIGVPSKRPGGS